MTPAQGAAKDVSSTLMTQRQWLCIPVRVDVLHEFAKRSLDSKILVVSSELSHKNALKAHQNGGESVECSNLFFAIIMSVFSL